jgi:hypothetical protein
VKLLVVIALAALLVVGLARCGGDAFRVYGVFTAIDSPDAKAFAGGLPKGLGVGPRTRSERVWIGRMNWECRRRNKKLELLLQPDDSMALPPALDVVLEYRGRADGHDAPASYRREAKWVSKVNAAKEEQLQKMVASRENDFDAGKAFMALGRIQFDTNPGLQKVGLRDCAGVGGIF